VVADVIKLGHLRVTIGLLAGCGLAEIFVIWRLAVNDMASRAYERAEFALRDEQTTPRAVPFVTGDDVRQVPLKLPSKTVYNGGFKYTFSGRQIDKMLSWIEAGDRRIRRDAGTEGRGLSELGINSQTYGPLVLALQANGYLSDAKEWTDEGIRWLRRDNPPAPDVE
jgi:hypothetical protein